MNIDFGEVAILALFRGVLGLAIGIALGNAIRDLRSGKLLIGALGMLRAAGFGVIVAFMALSIEEYNKYPLLYWGNFALVVLAGTFKTANVLQAISLGLLIMFGGAFLLFGLGLILSSNRETLNVANLIVGAGLMLVGAAIIGAMIYPYFKGKSLFDD